MKDYKKILLAVVLDPACDEQIAGQAAEIAAEFGSDIYVVHAIEHMSSYGAAYGVAAGADIEEMLVENAKEALHKLAAKFGVKESHCILEVGPAKSVILDQAERLGVDLVVVGSHGRQGIRLLLGSTANAVLHSAKCDVLAVRLKEEEASS